ncbi:hypothetical protein M5K25_008808 [Dendrobium thyrsiflorum]|uniref:Uncharacterized protein n=1 Tax=Dendrobium thyrsiflorum TaxID=117978 RepID=A0ABD0V9W4_DENTH
MIDIIHHPTPSQSLSFADYNAFPTVRRHLIPEGGLVIDGGSDDDADVGRQNTSRQSFPHPRYGMRVEGSSQQPSPVPPATSVHGPLYSDSPSVHELHTLYVPPRPGWHASLFHSVGVPQSTDTPGFVESTVDDEITLAPRLSSPFVDSCVERGLVPTTWTDGQARQQARVWRTDLPQTTRGVFVLVSVPTNYFGDVAPVLSPPFQIIDPPPVSLVTPKCGLGYQNYFSKFPERVLIVRGVTTVGLLFLTLPTGSPSVGMDVPTVNFRVASVSPRYSSFTLLEVEFPFHSVVHMCVLGRSLFAVFKLGQANIELFSFIVFEFGQVNVGLFSLFCFAVFELGQASIRLLGNFLYTVFEFGQVNIELFPFAVFEVGQANVEFPPFGWVPDRVSGRHTSPPLHSPCLLSCLGTNIELFSFIVFKFGQVNDELPSSLFSLFRRLRIWSGKHRVVPFTVFELGQANIELFSFIVFEFGQVNDELPFSLLFVSPFSNLVRQTSSPFQLTVFEFGQPSPSRSQFHEPNPTPSSLLRPSFPFLLLDRAWKKQKPSLHSLCSANSSPTKIEASCVHRPAARKAEPNTGAPLSSLPAPPLSRSLLEEAEAPKSDSHPRLLLFVSSSQPTLSSSCSKSETEASSLLFSARSPSCCDAEVHTFVPALAVDFLSSCKQKKGDWNVPSHLYKEQHALTPAFLSSLRGSKVKGTNVLFYTLLAGMLFCM